MRIWLVIGFFLAADCIGCGALSSLAEFDPSVSGVSVDTPVAPADGVTEVRVQVELRYSARVAARGIAMDLAVTGGNAILGATRGITDANGIFATTLKSGTPSVVRLAANIHGQSASPALQATVQFVSVAAGASLAFGSIATVGEPQTATVTIVDDVGQRVLYYAGTVAFSSSDAQATLPTLYQFTSADQGQHNFDDVVFNTPGIQSLRVGDVANANITASVPNISVSVKTAPMLEISSIAAALAGTSNHVQVRAVDIYSQTLSNYTGRIHFSSSDPLAALPADTVFTATDAGIKTLPLTLKTAGVQSVSAFDVNNLVISGAQDNIPVFVQADRFNVMVRAAVVAGVAVPTSIQAVDAYGNIDPNYAGPAMFSASDTNAALPAPYAFTPADAGVYDTNVTFYTAGMQTLGAQGSSAGFTGQTEVVVAGAPVHSLALLGPAQAVAGSVVTLVATAYDLYGNVSGRYQGILSLASSDPNAALPGPITVTSASAGSAALTPVILKAAGSQTITVTDAQAMLSATAQITVGNAPAAGFVLGGITAGPAGLMQDFTAAARDAYGNAAVDYTGTVAVTSDDPQAQLPPNTMFSLMDASQHTLSSLVLKTAGPRRVTVADAANANIRGSEPNIWVTPLAASALALSTANQARAAIGQNVVIRALDIYGNVDPNFSGTVTLASSDSSATLPAPYAFGPADAGQTTRIATLYTAGSQTLMASAGNITSPPALVTVAAGTPAKLGLSGLVSGRAGRVQSLVVQVLDNFNNLVPSYAGNIQVTSSDTNAVFPGAVAFSSADGGQKLVSVALVTAGLQSVTAHDLATSSIAGTQGNILITAVADRLRVQAPSLLTAGGNFNLAVAGVDAYGNVDANYTGTLALSTTSASSTLPPTLTITAGMQGIVANGNVALTGAGTNLTITAQDTLQSFSGTRSGIRVQPGLAASLMVQAANPAYVGTPFAAVLTAYDPYGNQATGYAGAVTLTSSDPGARLGATTTFVAGGQGSATAAGLLWSTASLNATLTATDTQTPSLNGSQTGIVVRPGSAAKLRVSGATSGLAGHADTVTVAALDNNNNLATGYTGTVRLSSTDTQAILPSSYAFTSQDAGSHTFTVSWGTAGNQILVAQDNGNASLTASQNNIIIAPRPAQSLRLTDLTGGTIVAGVARNLQVAAVDGFYNVDPNYTGVVTLTSSDANATLPAPATMGSGAAGVITVAYTLGTVGSQSLWATDAGSPALSGNLVGLVVQPGAVAALSLSGIADAPAGTSNTVTVEAVDAYGNRVPSYTGTVHLTSSDPLAVLSGDFTFRAQDQGTRTAQVTLFTGGQQSVTGTDTQSGSITGTQANINVRVSRTRLLVKSPSTVTAMQNFNISVAAVDAYGNIDPNYTGTVALTSSDALVIFGSASSGGPGSPASLTFSSVNAGRQVLSGVSLALATSNASITAIDSAQSLNGQRIGITVNPGPVTHFGVSAPVGVSPASPFAAQISAADNANNIVPTYAGSLSVTSTDSSATLPTSVTLASADAGSIRVGNLAFATAGPQSLTFTDANGITGSATTTVAALPPVALKITGATSGVAGHIDSVTVATVDSYGNPADGNVGVVTFTSTDAHAVLPGPYAFGSANSHTFAGVQFQTVGVQTLHATAAPPSGALLVGQQNNIVITGGAATRYTFIGLQDAVAGQSQNAILAATDAFGNIDPNITGTASLSSSDANGVMPATVNLALGQASVAVTFKTAGGQTLSASGGGFSGTSPTVTIAAAQAARIAVTGVAGGVAGQGATATLSVYDVYGNLATGYLGVVALSSTDPLAALGGNLTFGLADAGVKSASVAFFTAGTQTLTATDVFTPSINGQQSGIVVTAGQRFVLLGPTSASAGIPFNVTVQAVDNSNNVDTSFTGTVHFASTDARATLPADVTFAGADAGQKSISGFTLATAGTQTGVMATTLPAGRSGALYPITVSIGTAAGFQIVAPVAVTAGSNFNVTITAADSYGNKVPSYTGTALITSNDPHATLPAGVTFAAGDAGLKVVSATLRTATSMASLTATDGSNSAFVGQQGNITVAPLATVSSLALTGLTSGPAGHASSMTVAALDAYGNAVPQYRGAVTFSSSDALAELPASYTFVGADHGAHTFSGVILATVGNQSVTAADGTYSASQTVSITPAGATFFVLNTNSSTTASQAQNVVITATDAYGNVDINYAGAVTLTSSDPLALLPPTYTFSTLDAGRHTLNVTLQSAGIQSISAGAAGGVSGTQRDIVVNPGATSRLSLSGISQAGTGSSVTLTVRALDAAGNVTPSYGGTTHITSSDPCATLPPDDTYTSGAGGQRTASVTFATSGNQSLTATDTATPSITGTLANIVVSAPAVRLRFVVAANATAGVTTPVAVQVTDNFNNLATAYSGTVLLNLSDAQATYPAQVTFSPADQGNEVLIGTFKSAGSQTLAAVDTQSSLTSAYAAITIAPAATDHYVVTAPASVAAGGNIALSLSARDAYGNPTPSYAGTAHFTSSDVTATLPSNVTFSGASATPGSARATLASAATTFTATDVAHPAIFGTSTGVTVTPLATIALSVTGATSGVAGHAQSVTVAARDIYNNLVPGYRGTVAFASSDASATLPASYAFTSSDAGSHTFSAISLVTLGNQNIVATDTTTPSITGTQSSIAITSGAANQLLLSGVASSIAGTAQNFTVGAADAYGNLDGNFVGTVTFTSTDPQASLPVAYHFVAGDAGHRIFPVTLITSGTQTLTIASPGLTSATSSVLVNAATTAHLSVSGLVNAAAGYAQTVTVRAIDNYNNITPAYRGTVAFTSTDNRASLPGNYTYLSGDAGTKGWSATLFTSGQQQLRVADTQNANVNGAQNVVVNVQQTQLAVVSDTNVTAGGAFNVTISATDAYGNINPNYTGTVHLTSTDPNASLPADVTFTTGNHGVVTLTHQTTFRTASLSQSLTGTDSGNGFSGTQTGITVSPAPASVLAVVPPATVTAGTLFTLSVAAYDAYGNYATSYTGHIVFGSSDPNATLPPASNFTLANLGSKTFASGARLIHAGTQLITVTDSNNVLSASSSTTVQNAGPSSLTLAAPATSTAGVPMSVTVTATDAYGNTVSNMNDTVAITGSDAQGTYPGTVTFTPSDAGVKVLTNLTTLRTANTVSLSVTDTTTSSVTPGTSYIVVSPAPIASLILTAPASVTAAASFSGTIAGVDAYLNVVNNYTATVLLSSTDASGFPSSGTPLSVNFTAGSAAQRTLSNLRLATVGSQLLSAADANNNSIFGSTQVEVNPGAASALAVTTSPNVTAAQVVGVTVAALDAGGNIAPGFTGTVAFSSTDPNATLPPSTTFSASDHGQKTLAASLTWRKSGNQVLTVTSSGLTAGTANVVVNASTPTGLQLYGLGNLLAGATNQATLRAIDAYGNTAPSYTGTVTWTSSDPAASLPGSLTYGSGDMGVKTATVRLYTAGTQSVTATDTGNSFAATQGNIVVGVQRSRFVVTSPNTIVAGTPMTLSVSATDAYNNLDTNYTGTLHFASTDPNATFPTGIAIASADHGQRNIGNVVLTTVNTNANVTVIDNTNSIFGATGAIIVTPANANRLTVSTSASTPAGTPLTATVTAYDAYNNIATGYTGTVLVTTSNANAVLPAPTSFVSSSNGILSIPSIYLLSATSNASVTVTDNTTPTITGTQAGIQVTSLTADHFVLTGLTSGVAGHTNSLNVVVRDIYNNIATSYRGTTTFTSSDTGATLPTNYTYTGSDQGSHTFAGVSLATVGTQSVSSHDTSQMGIMGTQSGIVITSNSASHLTLTGGASTTAGQSQNILVAAVDAYGNVDPNFAGTVSFTTTDPNATLSGSYTFTSSNAGTRLLPVTYTTAATQTLTATGPAAVGNTQINTTVSPSNANAYVVNGIPNVPAGQASSVNVRVIDAYNNTVPLYRGQAHFTSSDTNATLPTDYAFVAADNGVKALGLTLTTAGTQWVRATDTNVSTITGQQNNITVGVAQSHLQVTCNTNVTAGVAFPVTVTAVDAYGNLNTGYTGTVHFTSGDPNATLPANANVINANNGSITVPGVVLRVATANQSITATDTNVSSYTGAQSGIRVNPNSVNALVLAGSTTLTAGTPFTGTVTAYDAFNNIATGYTGTVAFSSTDPNATLPASTAFSSGYAGAHAFTNAFTLIHAGNQNVTATDTANALTSRLGVVVNAATPATLLLSTATASTAGNVILAQVQAQDTYGNLAPTYRGSVAFSSGDPCASYPANYAFLAADNGNHVFSTGLVLRQSGSQVVNITDINNTSIGAGATIVAVNPAPLSTFRVSAPATVTSESSFIVTLAGLDIYGNTANTYAGTTRLTSSDPNGSPSTVSPINFAFNSGATVQRSVSGILLNTGGNQTLFARDANNPNTLNGQTNVFVNSLPASALSITGFPSTLTAGQQGNITVTAYDNYGNIATTYAAAVSFTSSDPNALLPTNYTFTAADQGVHKFTGLSLRTVNSNQAITATDPNGVTGTQNPIIVTPASPNSLRLTGPSSGAAGTPFTVVATALDVYGNTASGYTGTVSFASSNANAIKPSAYTFVSGDAGTHTFTNGVTVYLSGSQNVTITDANARTSTLGVAMTSANANNLVLVAPATSTAGANIALTLSAYDVYGNLATVLRDTVTFTSSDTNATLPAAYTFTSGDAGVHAFNSNTILRMSGVRSLTATDSNTGAGVGVGQANVTVSPNVTAAFAVSVPASVQPTLVYSASFTSRDAYGNLVPSYTGTVNLTSSDANGTPSTSTPVSVSLTGANSGSVTVNNLRLKSLGMQTLSAQDSTHASITGSASTNVQAQNFTANFNFTTAAASTFTYNTNVIVIGQNVASLAPIYTSIGDSNATSFAGGANVNIAYDSNGYLRIINPNVSAPWLFYSGLDWADPPLTWTDTVDAANGNVNHVAGFCCGIAGPETNPNATTTYQSNEVASALLYSGNAQGGSPTSAFTKAWSLQGNTMTLDANSVLSYAVFPQAYGGSSGNTGVNGNNSMYVALNVVFTDGTDTRSAGLTDANGITFTPQAQGAGGMLVLNQWNFVKVNLASLAGKTVDRIDVAWQYDGATGGYRGYIDQVFLLGRAPSLAPGGTLDASWTPKWSNLVGYWTLDGSGSIAQGKLLPGVMGGNLQAINTNGSGLSFVNAVQGQGVYMDGIDDSLGISPSFTSNTNAFTVALWNKYMGYPWAGYWVVVGPFQLLAHYFSAMFSPIGTLYGPVDSFPQDTWSHVAVVVNANTFSLYREAQLISYATSANTFMTVLNSLQFGSNNGGATTGAQIFDDIAVWNTALSSNDIQTLYQRQNTSYSGLYTSAPFAAPFNSNTTNGVGWSTRLPNYKDIVAGQSSEANSVYVSLGSTALNSNLVLLWHLDETGPAQIAGADFNDFSGASNNGSQQGTLNFGNNCLFARCPSGFSSSAYIQGSNADSVAPNVFTTSLWYRFSATVGGGALIQHTNGSNYDRSTYVGSDGYLRFGVNPSGGLTVLQSPLHAVDRRWHHVVSVLSSAGMSLYLDGALVASNSGVTSGQVHTNGYWQVGAINASGWPMAPGAFPGNIDEVAVWNRALNANEVQQLYRRGAHRVQFQVRQCTSSTCSDNPSWFGPDNTNSTYFSEMDFGTGGLAPGLSPLNVYSTAAPALTVNANIPYVQYRSIFQSDETFLRCNYAGKSAPCAPEVTATKFFRVNYPSSSPAIAITAGTSPYYTLASFAQTLGVTGCPGGVKYTLSPDGVSNYYYTGSAWAAANGSASQSTLLSQLTPSVISAYSSMTGPQHQTYFTAFLTSPGNTPCALQNVIFAGTQ